MDQVHLPDPVMEDITVLQHENSALCNKLIDLEKELRELKEQQALAEKKNRQEIRRNT